LSHITLLVASWNHNKTLAEDVQKSIETHGSDCTVLNLSGLNLPLYTPENEAAHGIPESLGELIEDMKSTDGYVAICPEYNGSVPPSFNNFIAWISRASSEWRSCFNGKGAAVMSFSGSGTNILQILRLQMSYLGCNVVGRQLLANGGKPAKKDSIDAIIDQLLVISSNTKII